MTLTDTQKAISAAIVLLALGATGVTVFQTQKAAAADKAELKQEVTKSAQQVQQTVEQLRAEVLLQRVKALAEKESKEGLTPSEKVERDLNLKQIEAIQAEAAKKSK